MKVVLGGGIAGLAAGFYLRQKFPVDILKIVESSKTIGGWIKSRTQRNGVIFEQGPRTLRPNGAAGHNTLELIDELGLSNRIVPILSSHPAAKKRMIYVSGQLHVLPSNLLDIFRKQSPFSKPLVSFVLNDLVAEKRPIEANDESIYSFVERRFGEEVAEYAISPMICGICAGDAKEISVKFLMKSLYEKEQKYGGVLKGTLFDLFRNAFQKTSKSKSSLVEVAKDEKWSVYSFDEGMEVLPLQLQKYLTSKNVKIELNQTCTELNFTDDIVYIATSNSEQQIPATHVVSCIPASNLASLLDVQHPKLAKSLRKIPSVDVAVVNLQFKNVPIVDAFGYLVPPCEKLPILGVIFDSCCFPNTGDTVLTVMMGGHWFQQLFGTVPKEEFLLETALEQIKQSLGIFRKPDNYKVNILRNCIPQYVVGHSDVIRDIEEYIANKKLPLSICGSSYYGVGVNDVIFSAKQAVDQFGPL